MAYSAHETRATNVPVLVRIGKTEHRISVDQTKVIPAGQLFRSVGKFELEQDREVVITVSNEGTDGFVIVDAIQWIPAVE